MGSLDTSHVAKLLAMTVAARLLVSSAYATCGGGGGGMGGITSEAPPVRCLPWAVSPGPPQPAGDLVLYWFPTSREAADKGDSDEAAALSAVTLAGYPFSGAEPSSMDSTPR